MKITERDRYHVEVSDTVKGTKTIVTDCTSGEIEVIEGHLTREDAIKEFIKRTA